MKINIKQEEKTKTGQRQRQRQRHIDLDPARQDPVGWTLDQMLSHLHFVVFSSRLCQGVMSPLPQSPSQLRQGCEGATLLSPQNLFSPSTECNPSSMLKDKMGYMGPTQKNIARIAPSICPTRQLVSQLTWSNVTERWAVVVRVRGTAAIYVTCCPRVGPY